MQIRS